MPEDGNYFCGKLCNYGELWGICGISHYLTLIFLYGHEEGLDIGSKLSSDRHHEMDR